tara:strand:+ start:156 stop:734 length:579 start_codon:yes stop_codon:yes gene_type:complete
MIIVEIKNPQPLNEEEDAMMNAFKSAVNFMRTSAPGKALGNTISKKIIDAVADHFKIKRDSVTYEIIARSIADLDMEHYAALLDDTKKGDVCQIIGMNMVTAIYEIVAEEIIADISQGVGGDNNITSAIKFLGTAGIRTAGQTKAGQQTATKIANAICQFPFKDLVPQIPGMESVKEVGGDVLSFFGDMFEE